MCRGPLLLLIMVAPLACGQLIIAHRGASFDAPENTLSAFRLAWERGADGVEGDFRITKDGRIVCIHDGTTRRTAAGKVKLSVAGSTYEELRRLDVGAWKAPEFAGEKIPTLEEVLATVPAGKLVYIEIKCGTEIVPLLQEVLETIPGVGTGQLVIISFNEDVVRACRQAFPRVKVNWLTSYKRKTVIGPWRPSADSVMATLKRHGASGLGTKAETAVVTGDFVDRLRKGGFEFHCWTINEGVVARQFRDLGADSITTDRPAVIRAALGGRSPAVR